MQLQLHYTNYTTPQLQLHDATTTTTAARHHATSSSCGWGDRPGDHCNHCSHSKKHSSNHLSVHQWIRAAIRDSQQPISPIGFLFLKLPPPPCAVLLVIIIAKTSAGYSLLMLKPPILWKSCGERDFNRQFALPFKMHLAGSHWWPSGWQCIIARTHLRNCGREKQEKTC